uniref:Putative Outer membrane efflux protein n=1 Tax=Magnetococcus massalia (strain MO-1) TaxID=451514 RepID=A0A1S7LIM4_MAGMO|nr:Putative Outer membrane efflux protein [Candidatus Magnetococcus massalia]
MSRAMIFSTRGLFLSLFATLVMLAYGPAVQAESMQLDLGHVLKMARTQGEPLVSQAHAELLGGKAAQQLIASERRAQLELWGMSKAFDSHSVTDKRDLDLYGGVTVTQPLRIFGRWRSSYAAATAEVDARALQVETALQHHLLQVMQNYFALQASEVEVQALSERHALDYVRWEKAEQWQKLGKRDPVDVAGMLAKLEKSRYHYYKAREDNRALRRTLSGQTGIALDGDLIAPPEAPKRLSLELPVERLLKAALQAHPQLQALRKQAAAQGLIVESQQLTPDLALFAKAGSSNRDLSGRDKWALGATLSIPLWEGGARAAKKQQASAAQQKLQAEVAAMERDLQLQIRQLLGDLQSVRQRLIAARAGRSFHEKRLMQRQTLYQMERVADLGDAMIRLTEAEAEMVRATGDYYLTLAQLACVVGEQPEAVLSAHFIQRWHNGVDGSNSGQFTPPSGSGFGEHQVQE